MTQGISTSLNLTLARLNSIESNFYALENIALDLNAKNSIDSIQNTENKDFQTILEEKIKEASKEDKVEKVVDELPEILEPIKQEAVNLKSKLDLKAQTTNIDEIIETFSNKYNVDSDFIKAIIKQESGFNPKATSKKGAMGLMQLMPKTAKSLGVEDAYNPMQNIEGGVKYIKSLLNQFDNNQKFALAAYNAGPNAVKRYGGIPPYKETQNYVNSIMSIYNKVKEAKL